MGTSGLEPHCEQGEELKVEPLLLTHLKKQSVYYESIVVGQTFSTAAVCVGSK